MAAAVAAGATWLPGPAQVAAPAASSTATQPPETVEEELTPEAQATLERLAPAMRILTEQQRPEDELPPGVSEHSRQKDPHTRYAGSTSRYLGQFEDMSFWVVISQDGLLCALESDADGIVGAVCDELYAGYTVDRHMFGGSTGPGVGREWMAWLVPDDYVLTPEETAAWTFPSPNLAVTYVDEIPTSDPRWAEPSP
ncbi:hypothetical protein DY240_24385 [Jiangella rhizosphaerae]|uniref:Uncharacterized protein n=1 Tax=Jiangella rhizosphaerae TaxID=2293569 RepID=A0A418KJI9_9ACTN|nr:hypothetical protein DY240_24385 [Jiangella rhizosphaerae]